jgi:ABC-type sulfate/molybdate transport systems ATPase subunit
MLTLRHLHISRLDVAEGECVVVRGESGAGKSLLLRGIADLDVADLDVNDGTVALDGRARQSMPAFVWRRQVMFVPAESGWWADRVGEHFLADGAVHGLLAALGLPDDVLDWKVARLSTGERHRLALARALSFDPKVMLLDEPSASLDGIATERLEAVLKRRLEDGGCLLLVTHDDGQTARMADRIVTIEDGRVTQPTVTVA